jgi:signal transduction histidine kinase
MNVIRRWSDAVVALLLLALMTVELAVRAPQPGESATTWWAYAGAVLIALPIAIHRRYPAVAVAIAAAGIVGYSTGHFVAFPGYAAFALVFVVSLHAGRGRGAIAFGAMALAIAVSFVLQSGITVTTSTWISSMLALAVAWLAGENLRIRQVRWVALEERARRLEVEREERARQAVTEERLRIARELHDVVAHSMSVIAVQAGVANHVIDSRPDLARTALATVETNSRSALVEMRRLLGVLRQENEPSASLTPAPGLADVRWLVDQFSESGLTVEVEITGAEHQIPDGVDLSAFRIVQEGLTNVLRHGGPRAAVRIAYEPGAIAVAIADDGRAARGPARPADRDRPAVERLAGGEDRAEGESRVGPATSGHGLIGMRERVAVFGGTLRAGPRPGGGFEVAATLPYDEAKTDTTTEPSTDATTRPWTDAPLGSSA